MVESEYASGPWRRPIGNGVTFPRPEAYEVRVSGRALFVVSLPTPAGGSLRWRGFFV